MYCRKTNITSHSLSLVSRLVKRFCTKNPTELWSDVNCAIQIHLIVMELIVRSEDHREVSPQLGLSVIEFTDCYVRHLYKHESYGNFHPYEVRVSSYCWTKANGLNSA